MPDRVEPLQPALTPEEWAERNRFADKNYPMCAPLSEEEWAQICAKVGRPNTQVNRWIIVALLQNPVHGSNLEAWALHKVIAARHHESCAVRAPEYVGGPCSCGHFWSEYASDPVKWEMRDTLWPTFLALADSLAALCLYEQPFGFDGAELREAEAFLHDVTAFNHTAYDNAAPLRSILAKVRALLPPSP